MKKPKVKENICPKCGSQLSGERVCPYCGQPLLPPVQGTQGPAFYGAVPPAAPASAGRRSHPGLIAGTVVAVFVAFVLIVGTMASSGGGEKTAQGSAAASSSSQAALPSKTLILDASSLAGASLVDIQDRLGETTEEGDVELTTKEGARVTGQAYSLEEGVIRFVLVDGKAVSMDYRAAELIPFQKETDIFSLFGIETASAMEAVINMGSERQFVAVSDKVSLLRVEGLDTGAKTFETVEITFDSTYGGRLSTEPKPADLEVLEQKSTKDYITGKIRNNTYKTYSYVEVDINLYNADGEQVGFTMDNVTNLEPGMVWEFKAPVMEDNASSFKIVQVTGA